MKKNKTPVITKYCFVRESVSIQALASRTGDGLVNGSTEAGARLGGDISSHGKSSESSKEDDGLEAPSDLFVRRAGLIQRWLVVRCESNPVKIGVRTLLDCTKENKLLFLFFCAVSPFDYMQ